MMTIIMMTSSSVKMMFILTISKMMKNFKNKLMTLMLMEILFLMTIINQAMSKSNSSNMMTMMNLTIFMVLESSVGLAILISSSRNSYITMKKFNSV